MSITLVFEMRGEVLWVGVSGHYTLPDAKSSFLELVDYLVQNPQQRVLVDCRQMTRDRPHRTVDDFRYAEFVAEKVWSDLASTRLAYLLSDENYDPTAFAETVARNRGANARVFRYEQEAIEWLEG